MQIRMVPQGRELQIEGVRRVRELLERLQVLPGTVLVIRGDQLLPEDARLGPDDEIEVRSVVSGGQ